MSQTINRLFDSPERAAQAAHALRTHHDTPFADVYVVTSRGAADAAPSGGDLSAEAIVALLMKNYVHKSHAKVLADGIRRGGTLVTVHALFGSAGTAIEVLESHGPIDAGVPDTSDRLNPWDDAAPLSSVLNFPPLLSNDATFSRFWNVPVLTKRGSTLFSKFGMPEISGSSGPYKGVLGQSLISHKATPLSSMLGLPVLKPSRRRR
jgi:hypothetical protein